LRTPITPRASTVLTKLHEIGNLELEEGGTIRGCKLAYATFGKLSDAKDNAILVPTSYAGTNKIIEQVLIGQGRALDPEHASRLAVYRDPRRRHHVRFRLHQGVFRIVGGRS
jgi:homoserine acetyltransferase